MLDADLALAHQRPARDEGDAGGVAVRLSGTVDAVVAVPGADDGSAHGLRLRGEERVQLGIGRRRRRADGRRIGGDDHRPRIDRPPQDIPGVVELTGHRVHREHPVARTTRSVRGSVVEHRARRIRRGIASVRRQPRVCTVARPVALQDHRHLTEGARLRRPQQLLRRDPGDAVVERIHLGRGVAGVRIENELLAGPTGTVRVRPRAGDRIMATVGIGVVVGHSVHGDRIQILGGAGRESCPVLTRQRRPRGNDHRGDLERFPVARGHHAAIGIDQPQPRIGRRAIEETGVDRRVGRTAAPVVDEIARHRVPQRLSRPVAKLDPQGPIRARGRLSGPRQPADEMAIGQSAGHAVGLAVVTVGVRVAIREGQQPRRMRLSAPGQARSDGPTDQRPPRIRERASGRGGLSRPHRRRIVEAHEQDPAASEDRQRQHRQQDGATLSAARAVPAPPATPNHGTRIYASRH